MSAAEFEWMLRATFYRTLLEPLLLRWVPLSHSDFHLRGIPRHKVCYPLVCVCTCVRVCFLMCVFVLTAL